MINKIVKKHHLQERNNIQDDLAYWLSKMPEERIAAVDYLRTQHYGNTPRLQRVARIIQRTPR